MFEKSYTSRDVVCTQFTGNVLQIVSLQLCFRG